MIKELSMDEIRTHIPLLEERREENLLFLNNLKIYEHNKDYSVFLISSLLAMVYRKKALILFQEGPFDSRELSAFIDKNGINAITGAKATLERLEEAGKDEWEFHTFPIMEVTKESFRKVTERSDNLSFLLTYEDFLSLAQLYSRNEEFREGFETEERQEDWAEIMEEEMEYPRAACGYWKDGTLIAGAYLSSATKESAMVVGVLVDKDYRGQGIGTEISQEITDIALFDHRINRLFLCPSSKKAQDIYGRLGYTTIGECGKLKRISGKED